jgi:hypothetical protein
MGGSSPSVTALTVYHDELIAGGSFVTAGGASATRIARWNGKEWQPLGTGANNTIWALAVYNDELIAGGGFTNAGGTSVNYVARWNGTTWQAMGTGVLTGRGIIPPLVEALAVYNGELYVGGLFQHVNGVGTFARSLARWNGTTWSAVGEAPNVGVSGLTPSVVRSLQVFDDELIVGGHFTAAGGMAASRIARWNGTSWQTLGTGLNDDALDLAVLDGDLIASGFFTAAGGQRASRVARWDGTAWISMDAGFNDYSSGLWVHDEVLFAGGVFTAADDVSVSRIARWEPCAQPCEADVFPPGAADGTVNVNDLLFVISNWGQGAGNPADVNGDNIVNIADLLAVIAAWGTCPV